MKSADMVIAGSKHLSDYALRFSSDVKVVPTCIVYSDYDELERLSDNELSIGWLGTANNQGYLIDIAEELKSISTKYPQVLLQVISNKPLQLKGVNIENIKWNIEDYKERLSEISVGIMPLLMDDWSKGKCAFKLIQYMAIGLPVVATDIGANATVITQSHDGFLVKSDDEWVESLSNLIESKSQRIKMGDAAKLKIKNQFSVESCTDHFESILLSKAV